MKPKDNSDLLKLKIKINCTNDIVYMDCAYLLDKPEFLRLLPSLRRKFSISKLVPFKNFDKWRSKKMIESLEWQSERYKSGKIASELEDIEKHPKDIERNLKYIAYYKRFEWTTQNLSRDFKRPEYFTMIIQHAIVCGEVGNKSYQTASIEVFPPELYIDEIPYPEAIIRISPMTTKKDLVKIFEDNVPKIFEENEQLLRHYYKMKKDPTNNIRRDREWYWRNLAGEGYTEIALSVTSDDVKKQYQDENNRYLIPEYPHVKQALTRYKRLLKVYI